MADSPPPLSRSRIVPDTAEATPELNRTNAREPRARPAIAALRVPYFTGAARAKEQATTEAIQVPRNDRVIRRPRSPTTAGDGPLRRGGPPILPTGLVSKLGSLAVVRMMNSMSRKN